jgi:hypothetical protein
VCDLFLDSDPFLSLRHLAIILYPWEGRGDLRYRVMDLRTSSAFSDEHGRRLEAVEVEGPLFVRCGEHALFFLPTSDEEEPWPANPEQGWACIPERVYLDDTAAEPDRWERRRLRARWRGGDAPEQQESEPGRPRTVVQSVRGPARAHRKLLAEGERPVGELEVSSEAGDFLLTLGPAAAHEGILLGRYERCDTEGLPVLTDPRISRVHLLLVQLRGRLYAVDAASSNGVWLDGEEVRAAEVPDGRTLVLGDRLARVCWRRAPTP